MYSVESVDSDDEGEGVSMPAEEPSKAARTLHVEDIFNEIEDGVLECLKELEDETGEKCHVHWRLLVVERGGGLRLKFTRTVEPEELRKGILDFVYAEGEVDRLRGYKEEDLSHCEESEEQKLCVKVWWLRHWLRDYLDMKKCPVDIHIFADGEEIRMWKSNACVERVATGRTNGPMWKWGIPKELKEVLKKRTFDELDDDDETVYADETEDEEEGRARKKVKAGDLSQ